MERLVLKAKPRSEHGKGPAHRLRAAGRLPAVVYGTGEEAVAVSMDFSEFEHVLHGLGGEHVLVDLKIGRRKPQTVLIKTVQHHPLRDDPTHVDFLRVRMDESIHTTLPVRLVGTPKGVKQQGGVLDHTLRGIEVQCLPDDLPEELTADVAELMIGESMHVSDIALPEGVTALTPGERVLAHVLAPRVIEEEVPVAEEVEEAAEVEPERVGEAEGGEGATKEAEQSGGRGRAG